LPRTVLEDTERAVLFLNCGEIELGHESRPTRVAGAVRIVQTHRVVTCTPDGIAPNEEEFQVVHTSCVPMPLHDGSHSIVGVGRKLISVHRSLLFVYILLLYKSLDIAGNQMLADLVHFLDLTGPPGLVEPRFEWAV
jgi:hypothetical protein